MRARRWLAILALFALLGCSVASAGSADPVLFSFATVGDSRTDVASASNAQDRRFLQNSKALARIVREIGQQRPAALFFNGDMIMGYTTDPVEIVRQYAYWRGMMAGLMESGTYVVPVPGNHEMQHKATDAAGRVSKTALPENAARWRDSMGDLILDTARWQSVTGTVVQAFDVANTPPAGGPDGNLQSQEQLSYSFDAAGSHFVVINTDPVGKDGHAPVHWLEQDLQRVMPLLYALRNQLELNGAKFGCGMALCGACTVHLDGQPSRACVTPVSAAAGKKITTIEAIGESAVGKRVQLAWAGIDVPQCGYCQSGQLMSAAALLSTNKHPSDTDIDNAMSGNICRCGTYNRIRAAIHTAAAELRKA